jgi:hypothetical protein
MEGSRDPGASSPLWICRQDATGPGVIMGTGYAAATCRPPWAHRTARALCGADAQPAAGRQRGPEPSGKTDPTVIEEPQEMPRDEALARLRGRWGPGWHLWYVTLAVGGAT